MSFQDEAAALSAERLAHSLREVRRSYRDFNRVLFSGHLRIPQFEWSQGERSWGAWQPSSRTIALSQELLSLGWGLLNEVLKHEMAHQYVDEVIPPELHEGPHGQTFRTVCRERGIDARAAADPRCYFDRPSEESEDPALQRRRSTLQRVEHLLALAQSDNQFEAENAMMTARRLMLKYNLEEGQLGLETEYAFRHLGEPTGRRMAYQRVLGLILAEHFFVELIIVPVYRPHDGKQCSVFEICGSEANLEIAAYVFDFLQITAMSLWSRHKQAKGIQRDGDKQSYLYGVMQGFASKLEADAQKNESEGLVWLGDPQLQSYFRARHPRIRMVSGQGRARNEAFSAGHEAGERIVLHRGVQGGHSGGVPQRLRGKVAF